MSAPSSSSPSSPAATSAPPPPPPCEPIRVVWCWRAMGPYHLARMRALAARPEIDLTVVERYEADPERAWRIDRAALAHPSAPSSPGGEGEADAAHRAPTAPPPPLRILTWRDATALPRDPASPLARAEAVVLPGWSERDLLRWAASLPPACRRLVWSVSTARDRPRAWWRETIKRVRVAAFSAALVAGSRARDYLADLGMKPDRIAAVGNAADPAPFLRARRALADGAPPLPDAPPPGTYAIYAGRLAPEKNLAALLTAWREAIPPSAPAPDLLIAGSGAERDALRAVADDLLPGRVHFAGETPPDRLAALLARAAFLVLPSITEPWGLVVNEALHAGRPVVLTDACGCVPELADGDHAFVAEMPLAAYLYLPLADAMDAAPTWDARGAAGALVADRFSPEACAGRVADALRAWLR